VSRKKRNILDDLVEGARRVLEDIENALNPEKRQQERAKVPVPIPVDPEQRRRQQRREFYDQ